MITVAQSHKIIHEGVSFKILFGVICLTSNSKSNIVLMISQKKSSLLDFGVTDTWEIIKK